MGRKAIPAIFAAALLLTGFVPLADRVLAVAKSATPIVRHPLRVLYEGRSATLLVGWPGKHRLSFDDGEQWSDPGLPDKPSGEGGADSALKPPPAAPVKSSKAAFWRFLDFWSPTRPEDFSDLLLLEGIDINRRGWVRMDKEGDELAETLGAMGESEPNLPQVWLEKRTGRMVLLALSDGSFVTAGPPGKNGLPAWLKLNGGEGMLTFIGTDGDKKGK